MLTPSGLIVSAGQSILVGTQNQNVSGYSTDYWGYSIEAGTIGEMGQITRPVSKSGHTVLGLFTISSSVQKNSFLWLNGDIPAGSLVLHLPFGSLPLSGASARTVTSGRTTFRWVNPITDSHFGFMRTAGIRFKFSLTQ